MKRQYKILLIGSIPPPVGGITIHIERFLNSAVNNNDFNLLLFDYKKFKFYTPNKSTISFINGIYFLLNCKIVHIHLSNDIKLWVSIVFKFLLAKKVIYTHHNSIVNSFSVHNKLFKIVDKIILVNAEKIDPKLIKKFKNKIHEIPAFIPPFKVEDLAEKWKLKLEKNVVKLSCNAYAFSKINGHDVYGLDITIKAIEILQNQNYNIQLIFVDPQNQYEDFLKTTNSAINILHINELVDYNAVIQLSDIVLRPTRTDGDSITVRESLYFNTPIIASNCVTRPIGTILFQSEDYNDLANKISNLIASKKSNHSQKTTSDYAEKIFEVYTSIIKN